VDGHAAPWSLTYPPHPVVSIPHEDLRTEIIVSGTIEAY